MPAGRLFLSRRIVRRECRSATARDEVVAAWRKAVFATLPAKGSAGCRLLKAYVTTAGGPRRTLYLLQDSSGDTILLMHRPKGDPIGDNMSYSNPAFRTAVAKAITLATEDIESGSVDVIDR